MKERLTRSASKPRRPASPRAAPKPSPAGAPSRLPDGRAAAATSPATVLRLQRLYGNIYVRGLLQAPTGRVQRDPTPEDEEGPLSDDQLLEDVVEYLRSDRRAADLHLTAGEGKALRGLVTWPKRVSDADLKARLEALSKQDRAELAARAVAGLETELAGELAALETSLVDELSAAVGLQLPDLAAHAFEAEEAQAAELAELTPRQRRGYKRRPPFPLIFKYLLRHIVFKQIESPRTIDEEKPDYRRLGEPYAGALDPKDEPLFPEIYDPEIVDELETLNRQPKGPRRRSQQRVQDAVAAKLLTSLNLYLVTSQAVIAPMIREEYAVLSPPVRDNIEGGLEGYFACRLGLLNAFGSPSYVEETLKTADGYYGSLVRADFLQGHGQEVKGASTIVHPEMKTALDNAEKLLEKKGWTAEVVAGTRKYWSTSIRENRNAPAFLSEHSFGMAIDINPDDNPNLAAFGASSWQLIEDLLGEDVFRKDGKEPTPAVAAIKTGTDPDAILAAVETIRGQSDRLKSLFDNEAALRARLSEIVLAKAPKVSASALKELLDAAAGIRAADKKTKRELRSRITAVLEADFWGQKPSSALPEEVPSELVGELVKALAGRVRNRGRYEAARDAVTEQIVHPARKPPAAAKKQNLWALFKKKVVEKLEAVAEKDRPALAAQVLAYLRLPFEKAEAAREAKDLASFLELAFGTFARTRKKTGEKIGTGAGLANVAAHGFTNLPPKLITALTSPQGGNLKWLGVHNQDMHHFELKTRPDLPQATPPSKAEPEPAAD